MYHFVSKLGTKLKFVFTCLNDVKCNALSMKFYINQRLLCEFKFVFCFWKVITFFLNFFFFPTVRPSFRHRKQNIYFVWPYLLFSDEYIDIELEIALTAILYYHHEENIWVNRQCSFRNKRLRKAPACAVGSLWVGCHVLAWGTIMSVETKLRLNTCYSVTNVHTTVCSFSDWLRKMLIYPQTFPYGGKAKWHL